MATRLIPTRLCEPQHAQKEVKMATSAETGNQADAILARLDEILQEVDMDVVTVNQITNKLAEELGSEVYDFKALLKVISIPVFGLRNKAL